MEDYSFKPTCYPQHFSIYYKTYVPKKSRSRNWYQLGEVREIWNRFGVSESGVTQASRRIRIKQKVFANVP